MGRHGANPGEQAREQEFVVDVTVWVEVDGDSLAATLVTATGDAAAQGGA